MHPDPGSTRHIQVETLSEEVALGAIHSIGSENIDQETPHDPMAEDVFLFFFPSAPEDVRNPLRQLGPSLSRAGGECH